MIQRRLIPTYIFLIIVAFLSVFPFYWMISAATNTSFDVASGKITIGTHLIENFQNLLSNYDLWQAMGNSFLYAVVQTILAILICSLAGFGFELYHDKGKDIVFSILLLAMMIPQVATMIPLFAQRVPRLAGDMPLTARYPSSEAAGTMTPPGHMQKE